MAHDTVYDLFENELDWDPVYDVPNAAAGAAPVSPYAKFPGGDGPSGGFGPYSAMQAQPGARPPLRELPVVPVPPAAAGLRASGLRDSGLRESGLRESGPPKLISMKEDGRNFDRENPQVGRLGVVYMQEARRQKHLINVAKTLTRARNGFHLDTAQLRGLFDGKVASGESKNRPGHAKLPGIGAELGLLWEQKALIWVCVPDERGGVRFYSGVAKHKHVHHSSFVAGGDVIGAGEWIVEDGALKAISANSGHYRPDLASLETSVRKLAAAYDLDNTKVLMWDRVLREYVHRSMREFLAEPGGDYKVHRDAPV